MNNQFHQTVTATALARNLAAMIDHVRISRQSLQLTKAGLPVAELRPPPKSGYPVSKLSELFKALPKLADDGKTMKKDLTEIRNRANLPENPWD